MKRTLIGARLKLLRNELSLSQEAIGAQGFVSAPGWIKLEVGQRQPSDKLIDKLCDWLVRDRYISAARAKALRPDLLLLKYLDSNSPFVRKLAQGFVDQSPMTKQLVADLTVAAAVPSRRGRPAKRRTARA